MKEGKGMNKKRWKEGKRKGRDKWKKRVSQSKKFALSFLRE